jgi:hypothetical protein
MSANRLGTGLPSTPRWAKEKLVEKPAGAALERLAHKAHHGLDLLGGGSSLVGGVAHGVETQGAVAYVRRVVERCASTNHKIEVFREGLEFPEDPGLEGIGIHALHILERVNDGVVVLGPARGDREAAVAGYDSRDPVVGGGLELAVPEDLSVEVGVDVDEAGGDGRTGGIEHRLALEIRGRCQ